MTKVIFVLLCCAISCHSNKNCEQAVVNSDKAYNTIEAEIVNGTPHSSFILNQKQTTAIGKLNGCSGTLIHPNWIITAKHCYASVGDRFCIERDDFRYCIKINHVINHQYKDLSLLQIPDDFIFASNTIYIPIMTEEIDKSWVGNEAEISGYGLTEDGATNKKFFVVEEIIDIKDDNIIVDGKGESGACFGDSGGPLIIKNYDNTVRVAGVLNFGDTSCRNRDYYIRTDLNQDWIEKYTTSTIVPYEELYDCD